MDSNECIICLDECKTNYIQYPTKKSGCKCKYYIHDECNIKFIKNECIICRAQFNNQQIEVNNDQSINNFRHELNENRNINCSSYKLNLPALIFILIFLLILVFFIVSLSLYY